MAHHHHHPSHPSAPSRTPITRPMLLRLLSVLALALPPILYLISMSLTLAVQYNHNYSLSLLSNSSGLPSNTTISSSPFFICDRIPSQYIDEISDFKWTCKRAPLIGKNAMEKCYARFKPGLDDRQKCQKIVGSAGCYVAGAVLVGLAVMFSVVYAVLAFKKAWAVQDNDGFGYVSVNAKDGDGPSHEGHGHEVQAAPTTYNPYTPLSIWTGVLFSSTTLLAILAVGCLLFAQMLGVQSLVNEQRPTASETPDGVGRWYMGIPALVWSTVAWLSASIGVFIAVAGRIASR